jgi:hypothetical protein
VGPNATLALKSGEWYFRFVIWITYFVMRSTLTTGPNSRDHPSWLEP